MNHGTRRLRTTVAGVLSGLVATAGLIPLATASHAVASFTFSRYAGSDRFDTARLIAEDGGTSTRVLIARGDNFPDALAGNYMAGQFGVPILLTRTDSLPAATSTAIASLGATQAVILGGTAAVSENVANQLRGRGMTVDRVAGATRWDTAQAIAQSFGPQAVGATSGARTAIVAAGLNFPDALAGGPLSYAAHLPILLTLPGALSPQARSALSNLSIQRVYLLGGTTAVNAAVENDLRGMGITVNRLAGDVRQGTAVAVANEAITQGFSTAHVNLARGDAFPDALTLGPHAGSESAPIVLTGDPNNLTLITRQFLEGRTSTLASGDIAGGTAAVSAAVENGAATAARGTTTGGGGNADVRTNQSSSPAGGTITGAVTGQNISSVIVNGCGFNNQSVTRDTSGNFSLTIPANQPAGACELVFTTTFTNGTTETDRLPLTISAPASTRGTGTVRPELVSASFSQFRTNPNNTASESDDFAQVDVRYNFDEVITGALPTAASFFIISSGNVRTASANVVVDPNDTKTAVATFGTAGAPMGTAEFAVITTGTVVPGAVTDGSGATNSEGAAPIQDSTADRTSRTTTAPDLRAIQVRGPGQAIGGVGQTIIDFTFDRAAFVVGTGPTTPPSGPQQGFHLVLVKDGSGANVVGTPDIQCTAPDPNSDTQNPSAPRSTPSGNRTSTISVSCPTTANGNTQITSANIARGYVGEDAVSTQFQNFVTPGIEGITNPLQAATLNTSSTPDLITATLNLAATGPAGENVDVVFFDFSEPVLVNGGAGAFHFYITNACDSGPEPGPCPGAGGATGARDLPACSTATRSSLDDKRVVLVCGDGTLSNAVGVYVDAGAVREATAPEGTNAPDEAGVEISDVFTPAGFTSAPDLLGVAIAQTFNSVGQPDGYTVTYSFDRDIAVVNSNLLKLYSPDGTALLCSSAIVPSAEADDHQARCVGTATTSGFVGVGDINRVVQATVGAVAAGAVRTQGSTAPATPPDTHLNPEGAFLTTGGAGTPVS